MVPDEPDLLRHVTQLDVRDNRLTELDASVFPRLEVLHCERNCIANLKAKGCLLKGIYASNNGGFSFFLFLWQPCQNTASCKNSVPSASLCHLFPFNLCHPGFCFLSLCMHSSLMRRTVTVPLHHPPLSVTHTHTVKYSISHLPAVIGRVRPCCRLMCLGFSPQSYDNWMSAPRPPISLTWTSRGEKNTRAHIHACRKDRILPCLWKDIFGIVSVTGCWSG